MSNINQLHYGKYYYCLYCKLIIWKKKLTDENWFWLYLLVRFVKINENLNEKFHWLSLQYSSVLQSLFTEAAFINQKYCENSEILLQFKITVFHLNIFWILIYSCDQSWIFSIITPVFSVTWSFRNHSNMLIFCSRNIINNIERSPSALYFVLAVMFQHPCWKKIYKYISSKI